MPDYRLYLINDRGHFAQAIEFACDDDARAIGRANEQREGRMAELWQLKRLVKRFPSDAG